MSRDTANATRRGFLAAFSGGAAAATVPALAALPAEKQAQVAPVSAPAEPDPFITAYREWVASCEAYKAANKAHLSASKGLPACVHHGDPKITLVHYNAPRGEEHHYQIWSLDGRGRGFDGRWDILASDDPEGAARIRRYLQRELRRKGRMIAELRRKHNLDALSDAEEKACADMHAAEERMRKAIPTSALGVALAARIYVEGIRYGCPDHVPVFAGAVALVPQAALDEFGPVPQPYGSD
ncbi:hypothetical protein FHP25_13245 [Vineibacter terrae]|uniref:Twin-arginine translocation signal domain-containing protein n=1 Tax=Vineibacter terrae TaxID=2586908 RepID=A0A5C8PNI7_9HYPH|nr:hypothetical protein [Vineibacter terrae]TXL75615.1 hypothetical protein FHP25_13245 [Vineibacter terrae]